MLTRVSDGWFPDVMQVLGRVFFHGAYKWECGASSRASLSAIQPNCVTVTAWARSRCFVWGDPINHHLLPSIGKPADVSYVQQEEALPSLSECICPTTKKLWLPPPLRLVSSQPCLLSFASALAFLPALGINPSVQPKTRKVEDIAVPPITSWPNKEMPPGRSTRRLSHPAGPIRRGRTLWSTT